MNINSEQSATNSEQIATSSQQGATSSAMPAGVLSQSEGGAMNNGE